MVRNSRFLYLFVLKNLLYSHSFSRLQTLRLENNTERSMSNHTLGHVTYRLLRLTIFTTNGNFSTPTELAFLSINPETGAATPPDAIDTGYFFTSKVNIQYQNQHFNFNPTKKFKNLHQIQRRGKQGSD